MELKNKNLKNLFYKGFRNKTWSPLITQANKNFYNKIGKRAKIKELTPQKGGLTLGITVGAPGNT